MQRKVRIVTSTRGKKRKAKTRLGALLPILFIAYLLIGMFLGIWINGYFYALEKAFYARQRAEPPPKAPLNPLNGE